MMRSTESSGSVINTFRESPTIACPSGVVNAVRWSAKFDDGTECVFRMLRIVCGAILTRGDAFGNSMSESDFAKRFGEKLKAARSAKGLSQEQLADLAGIHRTHVSLIERSRRSVRLETLERLAKALNVQPAELMPSLPRETDVRNTPSSSRQKRT